MAERRSLKQDRVAKGLCPKCGAEAAPYYTCAKCRFGAKVGRVLNRASSTGGFRKIGSGRQALFSIGDKAALDAMVWRPEPKKGDRRKLPRLRGIPVDVEAQLVQILRSFGRPVYMEEILEAWGGLREHRAGALVTNVVSIIKAKDDRAVKNARRAARFYRPEPRP